MPRQALGLGCDNLSGVSVAAVVTVMCVKAFGGILYLVDKMCQMKRLKPLLNKMRGTGESGQSSYFRRTHY